MRRIVRSWVILLVLIAPQGVPAQGPVGYGRVLLKIGAWLAEEVLDYGVEKGIDKALGLDNEAQLKQVEAKILRELQRGTGDTQRLRTELATAQSQLRMMNVLLRSQPTTSQLESFRRQLAEDLDRVLAAQREQEQRLGKLEGEVRQGTQELARLRDEIRQLAEQLRNDEERAEPGRSREADGIESPPYEIPRAPRVPREPNQSGAGVRLQLDVTCSASEIFIDEVAGSRQSDTGSWTVQHPGRHRFRILRGTGAVVLVSGDHNLVHVPLHLRGRVRIIDRGTGNRMSE